MWRSLGRVTVTTAGTPHRATDNETDPTARYLAHAILFQQVPTNTGKVYIMSSNSGDPSTGSDLLATLAIPTTNILQSASVTVTYAPSALNANNLWIDVENDGEGCQVSVVRA